MHISTKGRFAVNALVDLALREAAGPVALVSIGQRQGISLSYLEQLFGRLRRVGVVESTRGPGGGYTLARDATQISVAEIVAAVDESLEDAALDGHGQDASAALWQRLGAVMLQHMGTITLANLVQEQIQQGVKVESRPARRIVTGVSPVKPVRVLAPNSVFAFGRSFAVAA